MIIVEETLGVPTGPVEEAQGDNGNATGKPLAHREQRARLVDATWKFA